MQNTRKPFGRRTTSPVRGRLFAIVAAALLISLFYTACISKKGKPTVIVPSEARIVILPLNVPSENQDLRWTAMAAPILMGKVAERARDFKVAALWETMPTAIEAAGATRTFTPEAAASTAAWLSAKWAAMGEIAATKTGVHMMIDFIPSKTGTIPFRYTKTGNIDDAGNRIPEAFSQFAYYLAIRPLEPAKKKLPVLTSLKKVAEALDREYGWFAEAEPGKAQEVVSELAASDPQLARFLFSPSVYSILQQK